MKNKGFYLMLAGCVAALGLVVCWLIFGSKLPVKVPEGTNITMGANMKNTVLSREQDGKKLWEFLVEEVNQETKNNQLYLKGIKGKIYRKDGSFIDVKGDKGQLAVSSNDFILSGNVRAELKGEGYITCDYVRWEQKKETITANGKVVIVKGDIKVSGDKAITTSALKQLKVIGHAKAEKGGN